MVFRKEVETPPSPSFYFSDEQEIRFPTVHLLMSEWQPWSSTYSGLSPVISHTIRAQIDSSQDGMKWPLKQRTLDHVKAPMRQTERKRGREREEHDCLVRCNACFIKYYVKTGYFIYRPTWKCIALDIKCYALGIIQILLFCAEILCSYLKKGKVLLEITGMIKNGFLKN